MFSLVRYDKFWDLVRGRFECVGKCCFVGSFGDGDLDGIWMDKGGYNFVFMVWGVCIFGVCLFIFMYIFWIWFFFGLFFL